MLKAIIPVIVTALAFMPTKTENKPPEAIMFAITVYSQAPKIALHYPKGDNIVWDWVCVESWGKVDDKNNPGEYEPWYQKSCWKPRFALEDYALKEGAMTVKGTLEIYLDDVRQPPLIVTANVKPEEGNAPSPLVPFPGEDGQ